MTDSPTLQPTPAITANCPKCKYDLRSHLGPPMPQMVRCPECGCGWVTKDLLAKDARHPSKMVLVLIAFLGLPLMLITLAIVLGGNGILLFVVYPWLFAVIGSVHALISLTMAVRVSKRRNAAQFAKTVAVCALLYDCAIVLLCSFAASSPMDC